MGNQSRTAARPVAQEQPENSSTRRDLMARLRFPMDGQVPPYGTPTDDLYDEEQAAMFRKLALVTSGAIAAAAAMLAAAWLLACMPNAWFLGIAHDCAGGFDPSCVPVVYTFFRDFVPQVFTVLALCLLYHSTSKSLQMRIHYFHDDLPTSATLFSAEHDGRDKTPARRWYTPVTCLFLVGGPCIWLAATYGPLWGSPLECFAHLLACVCLSAGIGLVVFRSAYRTLISRSRHIDEYDELLPESGSDDDYKARIYADHAYGISRLIGVSFTLLAIALLLANVAPESIIRVPCVTVSGKLMQLAPDYARASWFVRALFGFAPLPLALFALSVLTKAALRHRRFNIEWSMLDVPIYPTSLPKTGHQRLVQSIILAALCIVLGCGAPPLFSRIGSMLQLANSTVNAAVAVSSVLVEVVAGYLVAGLVEHHLLSESAYCSAHTHRTLFGVCDETFFLLDGLGVARCADLVVATVCIMVSLLVLIALLHGRPITSWGSLAHTIMSLLPTA